MAIKLSFGSEVEHTIPINGLANASAIGGNRIDNSSNQDIDAKLGGQIRTGIAAPTDDSAINIYVVGSNDDTLYDDNYIGASGVHNLGGNARLIHSIVVDTTTEKDYQFGGVSVAQAFGGTLPRYWGVIVENQTGQTLWPSGSPFEINHIPVNYQLV